MLLIIKSWWLLPGVLTFSSRNEWMTSQVLLTLCEPVSSCKGRLKNNCFTGICYDVSQIKLPENIYKATLIRRYTEFRQNQHCISWFKSFKITSYAQLEVSPVNVSHLQGTTYIPVKKDSFACLQIFMTGVLLSLPRIKSFKILS